ncbi:hypothetical protein [Candidatus Pantoea bituminis]|nr:hypothetical protein [Pantoea bituminis]
MLLHFLIHAVSTILALLSATLLAAEKHCTITAPDGVQITVQESDNLDE